MTTSHEVAVVAGVGPGLGAALCRTLSRAGYAVAALARGTRVTHGLAAESGRVQAFPCDVGNPDDVARAFADIDGSLGPPRVLAYNAGAFAMSPFAEIPTEEFHGLWQVNCFGAFLCAREAVKRMLAHGAGTVVFTGATAGVKPAARFAAFGSSKSALRGMAQSMARELGPRGIHVAHVVIDGIICHTPAADGETCLDPDAIAQVYLHLIRQPRSAWTHELDLRPDREPF